MFLDFYQLDVHNKTRTKFANLQRNICENLVWKLDLPWINFDRRKCKYIGFLIKYTNPPTTFTVECRTVVNIRRRGPITFKHVSMWCLVVSFHPHQTYQWNLGAQLRKLNHLRPIHLILENKESYSRQPPVGVISPFFCDAHPENTRLLLLWPRQRREMPLGLAPSPAMWASPNPWSHIAKLETRFPKVPLGWGVGTATA